MSKSHEASFAEAIAELRQRLEAAGAGDAAADLAHDFVRWLIHEGWRVSAPAIESSPLRPGSVATPEQKHAYAEQIRAAIAPNLTPKETP